MLFPKPTKRVKPKRRWIRPFAKKPKRSGRVRNRDFLAFVHTLACCSRNLQGAKCDGPLDASHLGERPFGVKASDDTAVAQCRACHSGWENCRGPFRGWTKEQRRTWADQQIGQTRAAYDRLKGTEVES